jgi:transposase-like protein
MCSPILPGMLPLLTDRCSCAIFLSMMTFTEFMATFQTNESCREYLVQRRWPDGIKCPRCGTGEHVYRLRTQPFKWECANVKCRKGHAYRFSVTAGTIFENTKIPLITWFKVLYVMLTSKKGVSSRQVRRQFFGEQSSTRTAWYVGHRLRAAMHDADFRRLMGIVEVDETFVGGKDKNRRASKKTPVRGGEKSGKVGVIGAISRKGNVVCRIIENTDTATLDRFVRETVGDRVDLVATDEHSGYRLLKPSGIPHESVSHGQGEYVRGEVHTNNIESFWSLLKRGIIEQFHHVSKKYLPLYLAEFQLRHNNRKNPDIFGEAIGGC